MTDIDIEHHFGPKVYMKETQVRAGIALAQHMHTFDHLAYLASGTAVVEVDGVRTIHTAPKAILIAAGKHHGVRAVTHITWLCIHATDETDPDKIDHTLIDPASDERAMLSIAQGLAK